jgi:hypothetical protein
MQKNFVDRVLIRISVKHITPDTALRSFYLLVYLLTFPLIYPVYYSLSTMLVSR